MRLLTDFVAHSGRSLHCGRRGSGDLAPANPADCAVCRSAQSTPRAVFRLLALRAKVSSFLYSHLRGSLGRGSSWAQKPGARTERRAAPSTWQSTLALWLLTARSAQVARGGDLDVYILLEFRRKGEFKKNRCSFSSVRRDKDERSLSQQLFFAQSCLPACRFY